MIGEKLTYGCFLFLCYNYRYGYHQNYHYYYHCYHHYYHCYHYYHYYLLPATTSTSSIATATTTTPLPYLALRLALFLQLPELLGHLGHLHAMYLDELAVIQLLGVDPCSVSQQLGGVILEVADPSIM